MTRKAVFMIQGAAQVALRDGAGLFRIENRL